jgi:hypothetical protein
VDENVSNKYFEAKCTGKDMMWKIQETVKQGIS